MTLCWIAITDSGQFVCEVNGWMTSWALAEIDRTLEEEPLDVEGLPENATGILCEVWQEKDDYEAPWYWEIEPVTPLRVELAIEPTKERQAK